MKNTLLVVFLSLMHSAIFGQINVDFSPIPDSIITTSSPNPVYALDIEYGSDSKQKIDLFLPDTTGSYPIVIFIHGGGFTGGDKSITYQSNSRKKELTYFLDNGIAYASINYRLLPGENNPAFGTDTIGVLKCLYDSKYALQFLRYYANDIHINPEKVVVYGTSAGAGTSLWMATRDDMANLNSPDPIEHMSTSVCAAFISGTQATYDLYRWESDVFQNFDGNESNYTLDSIAGLIGFNRYNDFYGGLVDSTYDVLIDSQLIQYRQEVDMLYHLDANDPPLYILSRNASDHPSEDVLHHHLHSKTLSDFANAAGISEVITEIPLLSINNTGGESETEFLKRHLDNCSIALSSDNSIQMDQAQGFSIYPNPTQDVVMVELANNNPSKCSLFTLDGKLIKTITAKSNTFQIKLPEENGVYFLSIQQGTNNFTNKIVKE